MERLVTVWKASYFTELLLLFFLVVMLFISIRKRHIFPQLKFIPVYFSCFILLIVLDYLAMAFLVGTRFINLYSKYIDGLFDLAVTVIEIVTFSQFFASVLKDPGFLKTIKILRFILLCTIGILTASNLRASDHDLFTSLNNVYILESLFFLIASSCYFFELYVTTQVVELSKSSNFWIAAGVLVYVLGTLPYAIVTNYLFNNNHILYVNLYALVYIFYILFFSCLAKGYSCLKLERKPDNT